MSQEPIVIRPNPEDYELVELPALNGEGPRYKYVKKKPEGKFDLTRKFYERARRSEDPLGYDDYQEVKDKFGMYAPIVAKGAKTGDALLRGIMGLGYGASGLVGDITGNELLARDLAGMFESAGGRLGSPGTALTAPYRAGTTLGKAKVKQVADDVASDIKYGDVSFPATRGVLPEPVAGAGSQVVKKIKPSLTREEIITSKIDFTKSLDENIENLSSFVGTKTGVSNKTLTQDSLNRIIKRQMTFKNQDTVEGYKLTYKKMLEDRNYEPSVDYFNPLKLKAPEGAVKKTVTTVTENQRKAITELADELNMSRDELQKLITGATHKRKKNRALQAAIEAGPEALARYNQIQYGSPKRRRRESEAGAMSTTKYENEIKNSMNEKRSLENLQIKDNPLFTDKNIFNNKKFMEQLSTYVDPQTGSILKIDATKNIQSLIDKNKFWQIDHIYGLEHKSKVGGLPSNLQLIPGILNTNFKRNAEIFIKNNLNNPAARETIDSLIKKANELRITLRPEGVQSRLGYKQPAVEQGQSLKRFDDQLNFYYSQTFKQGGRVGHKEGGLVKPKINPIDYIVNYSDGTKLYKINSFIRDIARQIA